jgi:hypothetical protein
VTIQSRAPIVVYDEQRAKTFPVATFDAALTQYLMLASGGRENIVQILCWGFEPGRWAILPPEDIAQMNLGS